MFFALVVIIGSLLAHLVLFLNLFFFVKKDKSLYQKNIKEDKDYQFIKGLY
jgi:hypothetical protein